jgi:hypothetical protein
MLDTILTRTVGLVRGDLFDRASALVRRGWL